MPLRLAHLGPPGTFSEEAALLHDPSARLVPLPSVAAVATAVETGLADQGVVAIENSLEGSVTDTLDLLIHESRLSINRELVLPIHHQLLVKEGVGFQDVKAIYSHPQALGACRRFLERCFPKLPTQAALSTTAAVEQMLASPTPAAAIGTRRAASLYGAHILAGDIEDSAANVTRFVVLSAQDHPPTGFDKTSLCFAVPENVPGALVGVLQEFAQRHINLAKIESRPSKEALGDYIFLADLEGHRLDPLVAEALERVAARTAMLKIFGSYPRYREAQ